MIGLYVMSTVLVFALTIGAGLFIAEKLRKEVYKEQEEQQPKPKTLKWEAPVKEIAAMLNAGKVKVVYGNADKTILSSSSYDPMIDRQEGRYLKIGLCKYRVAKWRHSIVHYSVTYMKNGKRHDLFSREEQNYLGEMMYAYWQEHYDKWKNLPIKKMRDELIEIHTPTS